MSQLAEAAMPLHSTCSLDRSNRGKTIGHIPLYPHASQKEECGIGPNHEVVDLNHSNQYSRQALGTALNASSIESIYVEA
jgi:hypothetical protein